MVNNQEVKQPATEEQIYQLTNRWGEMSPINKSQQNNIVYQ